MYREAKSFVIASKPPALRASATANGRPGEIVNLRVSASASTRTILARLYGGVSCRIALKPRAGASVGALTIPDGLPAGRYVIHVTAEDIAHNVASQELSFDVLP